MIVKQKQLKKNTFKIITIWCKNGGFVLEFFEPYDDYDKYIRENHEDGDELECNQYARDEITYDERGLFWGVFDQ